MSGAWPGHVHSAPEWRHEADTWTHRSVVRVQLHPHVVAFRAVMPEGSAKGERSQEVAGRGLSMKRGRPVVPRATTCGSCCCLWQMPLKSCPASQEGPLQPHLV